VGAARRDHEADDEEGRQRRKQKGLKTKKTRKHTLASTYATAGATGRICASTAENA
jgi:hypothetical protein